MKQPDTRAELLRHAADTFVLDGVTLNRPDDKYVGWSCWKTAADATAYEAVHRAWMTKALEGAK